MDYLSFFVKSKSKNGFKAASLAGRGYQLDAPAMFVDDLIHHGQAKTCAGTAFGRKEFLQNISLGGFIHTDTVIAYLEHEMIFVKMI